MIQNFLPEPPCSHQPRWREELDHLPRFVAELRSPSRRFQLPDFTEENIEHRHNFCTKNKSESEIHRAFLVLEKNKRSRGKPIQLAF